MMKLSIIRGDEVVATAEGAFTASDAQLFDQYLAEYKRLMSCKPLLTTIPCGLNISHDSKFGSKMVPDLPSEDDRAIILLRLRPFILTREPASFDRVRGVIGRRVRNSEFQQVLASQLEVWTGKGFSRQSPIRLNGRLLNDDRLFVDWLNAEEYHRDPEKAQSFRALRRQVPSSLFEWVLVNLLLDKVRAVASLAGIVGLIQGELNEVTFREYRFLRAAG
jgi:hypothetical protein